MAKATDGEAFAMLVHNPKVKHAVKLDVVLVEADMVTSPVTRRGMLWFGVGCGLLTGVIRLWGGYPEGVSFAILLMNAATPLIDRWTRPRVFGGRKRTLFSEGVGK